jgi:histidinol-phosphate/aromatic aminotransferase/cobyric acid decarboxylase-like protein
LRAAYLTCPPRIADEIRSVTPPWVVSLVGQVAAVKALEDPQYYARRYTETRHLRAELLEELRALGGLEVLGGTANFLLCSLAENGPDAAAVLKACRRQGLFLRDATALGGSLGRRALRIAVKDRETNSRMLAILRGALREAR